MRYANKISWRAVAASCVSLALWSCAELPKNWHFHGSMAVSAPFVSVSNPMLPRDHSGWATSQTLLSTELSGSGSCEAFYDLVLASKGSYLETFLAFGLDRLSKDLGLQGPPKFSYGRMSSQNELRSAEMNGRLILSENIFAMSYKSRLRLRFQGPSTTVPFGKRPHAISGSMKTTTPCYTLKSFSMPVVTSWGEDRNPQRRSLKPTSHNMPDLRRRYIIRCGLMRQISTTN
jgi:hypothetical protein